MQNRLKDGCKKSAMLQGQLFTEIMTGSRLLLILQATCPKLSERALQENSTYDSLMKLYVKSQDAFEMSFKLKLCCFVSVPSLFKEEINVSDSFGIE